MNILELTLGILTSMVGFIDIGELVFNTQAGARFGLGLLWAIVLSAIIITVYAEMSGRVAIVTHKAVFDVIEKKLGFTAGFCTLIASNIVNIMTCAAEIGGVAFILHLLLGQPYGLMLLIGTAAIIVLVWILPFTVIEKLFGLLGLFMLIFAATAVMLHPDWSDVARNLIPHVPQTNSTSDLLIYAYFAVGIIAAGIMPYEVYFYSSGQIEEKKQPSDLRMNALTSVFGFGFGSVISIALVIIASQLFLPHGINPQLVGTSAIGPFVVFGQIGLLIALLGMFFAIGGAAVETCFAGAYNLAQFFEWGWGKQKNPLQVKRFTFSWVAIFVLALLILLTGIDPIKITEYAVIFSILVLPLTYLPILLVAGDKKYMGKYTNNIFANILGWGFFIIIVIVALSAIPLMLLTNGGQG